MTSVDDLTDQLPDLSDVLDEDDGFRHAVCPECFPEPRAVGDVLTTICQRRVVLRKGEPAFDPKRPRCARCVILPHTTGCPVCGLLCECGMRLR